MINTIFLLIRKNIAIVYYSFVFRVLNIWAIDRVFSCWIMIELNRLRFIGILIFNKNKIIEASLSYFLIQTISSLVFLIGCSVTIGFQYIILINWSIVIILLIKLGGTPIQFWVWSIAFSISWYVLWLFISLQKIIPIIILEIIDIKNFTMLIVIILVNCILVGVSKFQVSNNKRILIFLRISSVTWLFRSLVMNNQLWKVYLLVFALLRFISITEISFVNKPRIIISMLALAGIPPWPSFLPKLILIILLLNINLLLLRLFALSISAIEIFVILRQNYKRLLKYSAVSQKKQTIYIEKKLIIILITIIIIIIFV